MQEAGEAKRADRSELINDDQLSQLREYGDRSTLKYMNSQQAVLLGQGNLTNKIAELLDDSGKRRRR